MERGIDAGVGANHGAIEDVRVLKSHFFPIFDFYLFYSL